MDPISAEELKQRGYCCGQGCTNCPYWPKHQYNNTVLKELVVKESKFDKVFNEAKQRLDSKCWKGYRKAGTKLKGNTRVNNCIKK